MMSIGDAGNVLIGQHLGAKKPKEAANAKNVTYTLAIVLTLTNMIFVVLTHHWLPYVFNIPASALSLTRNTLLLATVYSAFEGLYIVQLSMVKAW
jgi:Na+-driven multidrug efflux pump